MAADAVGARLLGYTVQAARHLWEAARLEVGESNLERIEFREVAMPEASGRLR